jgi:hypothetical protein
MVIYPLDTVIEISAKKNISKKKQGFPQNKIFKNLT